MCGATFNKGIDCQSCVSVHWATTRTAHKACATPTTCRMHQQGTTKTKTVHRSKSTPPTASTNCSTAAALLSPAAPPLASSVHARAPRHCFNNNNTTTPLHTSRPGSQACAPGEARLAAPLAARHSAPHASARSPPTGCTCHQRSCRSEPQAGTAAHAEPLACAHAHAHACPCAARSLAQDAQLRRPVACICVLVRVPQPLQGCAERLVHLIGHALAGLRVPVCACVRARVCA